MNLTSITERNRQSKSGKFAQMTCPWCGVPSRWAYTEDGWDYYNCPKCDYDQGVRNPDISWWVNVYEVSQGYGGPEEGGWWYNCGQPVRCVYCADLAAAEKMEAKLRQEYPNTGRYTSVIYTGGDYRVCIEHTKGEPFPQECPHYE